jgi:MFS family permease
MGYGGDVLGRNEAMTLTLSIASMAAFCSAILPTGSPKSVYIIIIICRFFLGIGLGEILCRF